MIFTTLPLHYLSSWLVMYLEDKLVQQVIKQSLNFSCIRVNWCWQFTAVKLHLQRECNILVTSEQQITVTLTLTLQGYCCEFGFSPPICSYLVSRRSWNCSCAVLCNLFVSPSASCSEDGTYLTLIRSFVNISLVFLSLTSKCRVRPVCPDVIAATTVASLSHFQLTFSMPNPSSFRKPRICSPWRAPSYSAVHSASVVNVLIAFCVLDAHAMTARPSFIM